MMAFISEASARTSTTGEAVILDNKRTTAPAAGETHGFSLDLSKGQQTQYKKQFQDQGSIELNFVSHCTLNHSALTVFKPLRPHLFVSTNIILDLVPRITQSIYIHKSKQVLYLESMLLKLIAHHNRYYFAYSKKLKKYSSIY